MTELAVTIGGEAITLPPVMNFAALKRAWPGIKALGEARETVDRAIAAIRVVSAVLYRARPELTPEEIEERLLPSEIEGLALVLPLVFERSGLVPVGESLPAARSMAMSTD